jgi:hypothetical protein
MDNNNTEFYSMVTFAIFEKFKLKISYSGQSFFILPREPIPS